VTPGVEQTVREIALDYPASVRVFESLGIDYCCGGKQSLRDACLRANVPEESVLKLLANLENASQEESGEWTEAPFVELTAHIVNRHHDFVRSESPRLVALAGKVATRHGMAHPELAAIKDLFAAMARELSIHMLKEEQVLFPYLNSMDTAIREGKPAPPAFFGSVRNPIAHMLADHEDAGASLAQMSSLSGRYQAPPDACPSYTALYHGLQEFERDLHRHVHLENNILFPRALEMEKPQNRQPI
jgi:regulator of cell morphogenesis and NO signaling